MNGLTICFDSKFLSEKTIPKKEVVSGGRVSYELSNKGISSTTMFHFLNSPIKDVGIRKNVLI